MTKSEEIMGLVDMLDHGNPFLNDNTYLTVREKLQAFADEYQELKYCYSPDKVLRTSVFKDRRAK